jgi:hypothetical protein
MRSRPYRARCCMAVRAAHLVATSDPAEALLLRLRGTGISPRILSLRSPYFPFPFRRTVALASVASRSKAKAATLTWT